MRRARVSIARRTSWEFMIHFLSISIFPILMIIAGAGDALSLRIPNWLTLAIFAAFFPLAWATGMPLADFGLHVLTAVVLLVVGFASLLRRAVRWRRCQTDGRGGSLVWQLAGFAIFGFYRHGRRRLGALRRFVGRHFHELGHSRGSWAKKISGLKPNVPYGYAIAIGAILAFPESWWMVASG